MKFPNARISLESEVGSRAASWIGGLAGLFVFFTLYNFDFITGKSPFWQLLEGGDPITNLGGALYFLRDKWHYPLFFTNLFNLPYGQNILLTGSVPFFAGIAKLFVPLFGGQPFNYLGVWYFGCYLAQGVFSARFFHRFGLRSPWMLFCIGIIACTLPTFLYLFQFNNFLCQFLIWIVLTWSFSLPGEKREFRHFFFFGLLQGVILLTDIYLFAMTFPLFAAHVIDQVRSRDLRPLPAALVLGSSGVLTGILLLVSGFIVPGHKSTPVANGYGTNSTNVIGFLYGFSDGRGAGLMPPFLGYLEPIHYHGYVYLGLGVIGCGFIALLHSLWKSAREKKKLRLPESWMAFIQLNLFVILGLLLLWVHSWSNQVYFLKYRVLQYKIPHSLTYLVYQLRSTYRFAWPLMYCLFFLSVFSLYKTVGKKIAAIILVFATLIQWVDVGPALDFVRDRSLHTLTENDPKRVLEENSIGFYRKIWKETLPAYSTVRFMPSFQCAPIWKVPGKFDFQMDIFYQTAVLGIPTYDAYIARFDRDCRAEKTLNQVTELEKGTLYFVDKLNLEWLAKGAKVDIKEHCRTFTQGWVCADDLNPLITAVAAYPAYLQSIGLPPATLLERPSAAESSFD